MLDWYAIFTLAVLVLWLVSSPGDRNALRIVLIATLAAALIVDSTAHQITGAWRFVIPGAVDLLTISALLRWSRNRTGWLQVGLLVISWLANLLCCMDKFLKTDLVSSRYELIIQLVAVGQLAAFHDTVFFNLGRAWSVADHFQRSCVWGVSRAGWGAAVLSAVLRFTRKKGLQAAAGKPQDS